MTRTAFPAPLVTGWLARTAVRRCPPMKQQEADDLYDWLAGSHSCQLDSPCRLSERDGGGSAPVRVAQREAGPSVVSRITDVPVSHCPRARGTTGRGRRRSSCCCRGATLRPRSIRHGGNIPTGRVRGPRCPIPHHPAVVNSHFADAGGVCRKKTERMPPWGQRPAERILELCTSWRVCVRTRGDHARGSGQTCHATRLSRRGMPRETHLPYGFYI